MLVTRFSPLNDEKIRNIKRKEEFQLQFFFSDQVMFENSVINLTMLVIIQVLKTILFKFYKRRKKWGVVCAFLFSLRRLPICNLLVNFFHFVFFSFYDKKKFSSKKEQKTIDASEKVSALGQVLLVHLLKFCNFFA